MTTQLIVITIIGIIAAFWLSTVRLTKPTQGELSIQTFFGKHISVIGLGIPDIKIDEIIVAGQKILDATIAQNIKIRVDRKDAVLITGFPYGFETYDYRYKKYKTLDEVQSTGGFVRWQPTIEKDKDGKPLKVKNEPDTIVLGEWKKENTISIKLREREEIAIPFQSQDGVRGVIGGYIKFIIWDVSLAISSTHNFKTDPEKAIIDLFQSWARTKNYLKEIQGVSFEEVIKADNTYLQCLNRDIYLTGVIIEGIEFDRFFVEPESRDIIEAQEQIEKNRILSDAEDSNIELKKKQGVGDAEKLRLTAQGQADSIKIIAEAKAEEVDKVGSAENVIKSGLDKSLKENEAALFEKKTETTLAANGKIIDKIGDLKKIPDATTTKKYWHLSKMNQLNTLILHGDETKSGGDKLDELLESNIIANQITHPQNQGGTNGNK